MSDPRDDLAAAAGPARRALSERSDHLRRWAASFPDPPDRSIERESRDHLHAAVADAILALDVAIEYLRPALHPRRREVVARLTEARLDLRSTLGADRAARR